MAGGNAALVVAAVLAGGFACGDAAGPGGIEGTYSLRTLNGEPMPYDNNGLGCCVYLAGTLGLSAGQYSMSITARNLGGTEPFTAVEWGSYSAGVAAVTFAVDSFSLAPLLPSPATVSGDTIALGVGGEGPGAPDQFQARFVRDR